MTLTVYYKYQVSEMYFKEEFKNITEEEATKIEKRYISNYEHGEYVDFQIERS